MENITIIINYKSFKHLILVIIINYDCQKIIIIIRYNRLFTPKLAGGFVFPQKKCVKKLFQEFKIPYRITILNSNYFLVHMQLDWHFMEDFLLQLVDILTD